ncbi:hypothetical protein BH09BAC6_BH09BAC6_25130 [soil metagenome]|jgi:LPS export ABC transporter protein LptC
MLSRGKRFSKIYLPALVTVPVVILMLLLSSCENSLKDIKKIASKEEEKPISRSTGVDIVFSDSAKVKAHMITPLMYDYDDPKKPYQEMPKGVKIIFYDEAFKEKGRITSDYAIRLGRENVIQFKKNVVATNADGTIFKSEELFYDDNTKKLSSTKAVQITSPNGNVMNGVGFHSNVSLYPWTIDQATGVIHVDEKQAQ